MKKRLSYLVILTAALMAPLLANVKTVLADDLVEASIIAGQEELSVGDVVQLTLRVTHPDGYRVLPVQLGQNWGEFEIRSVSELKVELAADGSVISSQTIDVTLWAPGSYETPELIVSVVDEDGVQRDIIVQPQTLQVKSVLMDGDNELRDIKPQATLPLPPLWPWIVGGLLALAVITILVQTLRRRRQGVGLELPESTPDLRPAYLIALEELTRIEGLDLPSQGLFKTHYTLVTDALRQYLEGAYQVPAMDRTTAEIRHALGRVEFRPAEKKEIVDLLREADLVKFARVVPELGLARQYPAKAKRLVEATQQFGITASALEPSGQMSEVMA